jgi:K+-sensing histidine kinase KdpD
MRSNAKAFVGRAPGPVHTFVLLTSGKRRTPWRGKEAVVGVV